MATAAGAIPGESPLCTVVVRLGLGLQFCQDVPLAENQVVDLVKLDFSATVLRVDNRVAFFYLGRDQLSLFGPASRSDRDDLTFLRLFFCGVRKEDTPPRCFIASDWQDDHPVAKRLDLGH